MAILAAALCIVAPALLSPPFTHDSFWIDWVWADQFTGALRGGTLYPRWLPLSHGGLGSPVFYYYPPLAFYVSGAFGLAGLSTYASLIAAFGAAFVASGYAMYAWLDGARYRLVGALLFMAAPYHVLDFYDRGALAECMAIAFIPLVALALTRERPVLLALSYAGLILSHLPLALLTSLFVILPMIASKRAVPKFVMPLGVGLLIAAVYLVPAFALDQYRDSAMLWAHPSLRAENWSVWASANSGPAPGMRLVALLIPLAHSPAIVALWFRGQRTWAALATICAIVTIGLIPGFWTLPLVSSVQFPFRMLPLVEFYVITGAASSTLLAPLLLIIPLLLSPAAVAAAESLRQPYTIATLARFHPDVPENLPPGPRPYSFPSTWALSLARMHPDSVFYFPSWAVTCSGKRTASHADPETVLLSYSAENCSRKIGLTAPERAGWALSLLGLLALGLLILRRRKSSNGELAPPADPEFEPGPLHNAADRSGC